MKNETMEQINNTITQIVEKEKREYNEFFNFMSNQKGSYVFVHAYECSSKTDINFYFQEGGFSEFMDNKLSHNNINLSSILERLQEFLKENILDSLYEAYFHSSTLSTDSWNDLNDLIRYVIFYEII